MEKNKLEFKQIAPYLTYGLGILDLASSKKYTLHAYKENYSRTDGKMYIKELFEEYKYKPILRPLNDLMKDIKNGYANFGDKDNATLIYLAQSNDTQSYQNLEYSTILFLCKNHYDFQLLIEKGLAIDINSLKNQDGK